MQNTAHLKLVLTTVSKTSSLTHPGLHKPSATTAAPDKHNHKLIADHPLRHNSILCS